MLATNTSGAGIMLMEGGHPVGSLAATNAVSSLIEELQFTLGEGPCIDAYNGPGPVSEPDLASNPGRWPIFTHSALEAGVRAIFGFPILVDSVSIAALSLYRDRPGSLTEDQRDSAVAIAALTGRRIMALQRQARQGAVAEEFVPMLRHRDPVYRATGMVSVQLGVNVDHAMLRLRACALANGCGLTELCGDVVARRLRFEPEIEQ